MTFYGADAIKHIEGTTRESGEGSLTRISYSLFLLGPVILHGRQTQAFAWCLSFCTPDSLRSDQLDQIHSGHKHSLVTSAFRSSDCIRATAVPCSRSVCTNKVYKIVLQDKVASSQVLSNQRPSRFVPCRRSSPSLRGPLGGGFLSTQSTQSNPIVATGLRRNVDSLLSSMLRQQ